MTKYPGNPWWSESTDLPIPPSNKRVWDDAQAHGFITAEHILLRLDAMLRVAVGEPVNGGLRTTKTASSSR